MKFASESSIVAGNDKGQVLLWSLESKDTDGFSPNKSNIYEYSVTLLHSDLSPISSLDFAADRLLIGSLSGRVTVLEQ